MTQDLFHTTLKKWWGYNEFRPNQLDVIKNVYAGHDTMVLMPTGAGKSILYQVPAMMLDGVCIVVTPLVALMKDQVDRLKSLGILASAVHSGMTTRQIDLVLDKCAWGGTKFLYVAPERVQSALFRTRLRTMTVSLIAIDESHCISQWGYDFRPSYLKLAELRDIQPSATILAVTASATPKVVDDIMLRLKMKNSKIFKTSFRRSNISFAVRKVEDRLQQILRVVKNVEGCGIVYVRTRDKTVEIAEFLKDNGCSAEYYNGGMKYMERSMRQEQWSSGKVRVMVATNAFGLGIDQANVRFVVHYDVCDSLEAYYQEAGRGGRDGKRAYALMLTTPDDRYKAQRRFDMEFPSIENIKKCYDALFNYLKIEIEGGKYATISFNIFAFSSAVKLFSTTAINSLKILQLNGYLTLTEESDNPPRIMFTISRNDLYKIRIERDELNYIIQAILRIYQGVFGDKLVAIDEQEIAHHTGYKQERVHELLKMLWQLRVIKYVPGNRSPLLILHEERLPLKDIYISPESYEFRKRMYEDRQESMLSYSESENICRSRSIQEYFGEVVDSDCGSCDVCIVRKKDQNYTNTLPEKIKNTLRESSKNLKELVALIGGDSGKIVTEVDQLLSDSVISIDNVGKLRIN